MYLDKNSVRVPMFGVWVLLMLSIDRVLDYFKDLKFYDHTLGAVLIIGLGWFIWELRKSPQRTRAGAKSFGWYLLGYIVVRYFYEGLIEGFPDAKILGDIVTMILILWVYSVAKEYINRLNKEKESLNS